jgi:hypothetical protein
LFIVSFKVHLLTDSRLLFLGSHLSDDSKTAAADLAHLHPGEDEKIDDKSYDVLAQLSGF